MGDTPNSHGGSPSFASTLLARIRAGTRMLEGKEPTPRGFFKHVYGDVQPDEFESEVLLEALSPDATLQTPDPSVLVPETVHEPTALPDVATESPVSPPTFRFRPFGFRRSTPVSEPTVNSEPNPRQLPEEPVPATTSHVDVREPELEPEEPQDAYEVETSTAHQLARFATDLEMTTPPENGTEHLSLRALVKLVVPVAPMFALLADDQIDQARTFVQERHASAVRAIRQLQEALSVATRRDNAEEAITTRVDAILIETLTEEVRALPSVFRTSIAEVRSLLETYASQRSQWDLIRMELLGINDQMQLSVADLAFAHERRGEVGQKGIRCHEIRDNARRLLANLEHLRTSTAEHGARMAALEMNILRVNERASEFNGALESVCLAAERLGVLLTSPIYQTACNLRDRVRLYQERLYDSTQTIPIIEIDSELRTFIDDTFPIWERRINQILNPIRPSVFIRPLDRPEELQRLALCCVYFLTRRKPRRPAEDGRHPGTSSKTYAQSLVFGDLIDECEIEFVEEFIKNESKKGRTETIKQGWSWKYRLRQDAEESIRMYVESLVDQDTVRKRILKGVDLYFQKQRESRADHDSQSNAS